MTDYETIWIKFASSALAGACADPDLTEAVQAAAYAATAADRMLEEYRDRMAEAARPDEEMAF